MQIKLNQGWQMLWRMDGALQLSRVGHVFGRARRTCNEMDYRQGVSAIWICGFGLVGDPLGTCDRGPFPAVCVLLALTFLPGMLTRHTEKIEVDRQHSNEFMIF